MMELFIGRSYMDYRVRLEFEAVVRQIILYPVHIDYNQGDVQITNSVPFIACKA